MEVALEIVQTPLAPLSPAPLEILFLEIPQDLTHERAPYDLGKSPSAWKTSS